MSSVDEFLNIDTPENVVFGYEVAGIGSRFLAALADTIIILIMELVLLIFLNIFLRQLGTIASTISTILSFLVLWGYYIVCEMIWNGQTPGKRWVGLRVIRKDGSPITLSESIIRNIVRFIDFLPLAYGVGVITMFINKQSCRLGDLAAGTLVVYEQENVTLASLSGRSTSLLFPIDQPTPEMESLPVEKLTEQDIQIVQSFLLRRRDLSNTRELTHSVLRMLLERMEIEIPPHTGEMDAMHQINTILRAWQFRFRAGKK